MSVTNNNIVSNNTIYLLSNEKRQEDILENLKKREKMNPNGGCYLGTSGLQNYSNIAAGNFSEAILVDFNSNVVKLHEMVSESFHELENKYGAQPDKDLRECFFEIFRKKIKEKNYEKIWNDNDWNDHCKHMNFLDELSKMQTTKKPEWLKNWEYFNKIRNLFKNNKIITKIANISSLDFWDEIKRKHNIEAMYISNVGDWLWKENEAKFFILNNELKKFNGKTLLIFSELDEAKLEIPSGIKPNIEQKILPIENFDQLRPRIIADHFFPAIDGKDQEYLSKVEGKNKDWARGLLMKAELRKGKLLNARQHFREISNKALLHGLFYLVVRSLF
jgi:hypothetical protein